MVDKIEEVKKLVKGVIDKYKIFEGEFQSITYYWGGDYEEKTYRAGKDGKIICRVSENEIIGRLRWFLRTVYARFSVDKEHLKDYKKADSFLSFLGTSNPKESIKSSYLFRVEDVKCEKLEGEEKEEFEANMPARVKLVLLKYKDESEKEYHYPLASVTFSLKIFNTANENKDFLIVGGTILTLAYLGIGKATSRGFGRFYLVKNNKLWIAENLRDNITKLIDYVLNGEIREAFKYFYINIGFDPYNPNNYNKWTDSSIPLAPLPCDNNEDCIKVVKLGSKDLLSIMNCINRSTLKSYYKKEFERALKGTQKGSYSFPSIGIHTWVFGFPRAHISGKEIETGYYYKDDKNANNALRRASLVIISPVKRLTDEYDIVILPFLSLNDLREKVNELYHKEEYKVDYPPNIVKEIEKIKKKLEKDKKLPRPPGISLIAKIKVADVLKASEQINIQFEDKYEEKVNEIYKEIYEKLKDWYRSKEKEQLSKRVEDKTQILRSYSDPQFRHLVSGKIEEVIKAYVNHLQDHIKNLCGGTRRQSYEEQKRKQTRHFR